MSVAALVLASVLIAVAGGLIARAEWAVVRGRTGVLERLWIALPAAFLVLLIVAVSVRAAG